MGRLFLTVILTAKTKIIKRAIDEFKSHGGQQITMVCIPTNGFFSDAAHTLAERSGAGTLASHVEKMESCHF